MMVRRFGDGVDLKRLFWLTTMSASYHQRRRLCPSRSSVVVATTIGQRVKLSLPSSTPGSTKTYLFDNAPRLGPWLAADTTMRIPRRDAAKSFPVSHIIQGGNQVFNVNGSTCCGPRNTAHITSWVPLAILRDL